ncbi:hypothetical protein EAF04_007931 [Stromatinia cepivora]|nr:hypothetical protein EAF04_007931 [Stromatinia cepivora]
MTGSFWHNVLPFRRPSSSASSTSTISEFIDSSSRSSLNLSVQSSHKVSRKRRELFGDFEYSLDNGSMNANMQEPMGMERNYSGRDTGFPEPLCHDRNTTLRHPEADTSPYATLESTELDIHRSHSRLSLRRLHSKHKGSFLSVPLHEEVEYTDETEKDDVKQNDLADPDKTEEEYVEMEGKDDQGYRSGERKKGMLQKLSLHRG